MTTREPRRTAVPEDPIVYAPIGMIRTPFTDTAAMPIQPAGARGIAGRIELRPDLARGIKDLEGFSHLVVLYHFHRVGRSALTVIPFLDSHPRGVFATRAPVRPNPIGLSVLALRGIDGCVLLVADVDMLDGTPLLDIKPYVTEFDRREGVRTGWLENAAGRSRSVCSDRRFD